MQTSKGYFEEECNRISIHESVDKFTTLNVSYILEITSLIFI